MSRLVFLGGTSAKNDWRESFIEDAVKGGVARESLFNPVVKDWNAAAQEAEEKAKATATEMVFYIADPKQEGNPLSAYSMVEATMALYDKPDQTVVVFDTEGMTGHPLKSMDQTKKVLQKRFPSARIFTRAEAVKWLTAQAGV